MVSRLSTDHVKHYKNRIENKALNKHHTDKESAAEEYTLG